MPPVVTGPLSWSLGSTSRTSRSRTSARSGWRGRLRRTTGSPPGWGCSRSSRWPSSRLRAGYLPPPADSPRWIVGYVLYLVLANGLGMTSAPIDFTGRGHAALIGLPNLTAPTFDTERDPLIAPIAIVLVAENLGHVKAVSAMTGRNLDPYLGRAFLGDGLATMRGRRRSAGTGVTTYAENIGVMAVTRIYSSLVFVIAGVVAVVMGFSPKFGALIGTIPTPVIGGLAIVLFGLDRRHRRPDLGPEQGRLLGEPEPRHGRRGAHPGRRRPHPHCRATSRSAASARRRSPPSSSTSCSASGRRARRRRWSVAEEPASAHQGTRPAGPATWREPPSSPGRRRPPLDRA